MSILKDINCSINEEDRIFEHIESLMSEITELLNTRFSIMELEYNPDGSVEWDPEQAKPPGGGGGITRDVGAGLQRRRTEEARPNVGDVVLMSNEKGQAMPVAITDIMDRNIAIVINRREQVKQKVDLTTLRPAQSDTAVRFAKKYPDKKIWQVG